MKFIFPRFFIVAIILFCIDIYSFQAVKMVTRNLGANARRIIHISFWAVTCLVLILFITGMFSNFFTWPKLISTYVTGFLLVIYVCKLIVIPFLFVDDFIRLGRWIVSLFTSKKDPIAPESAQITRS